MSTSGDTGPTPDNLRAVQVWLNHLDDLSESQPQAVLDASQDALPLLATWTGNDAYAWALALRAKSFRFLDRLADVLDAAASGLEPLRGDEPVAAHLHLEAGMALNQFGRQPEAVEHLRAADRVFEAVNDEGGRAWALVSLAEAYAGSGMSTDPEPILRLALDMAERSGDSRAGRRGWKQLAVLYRHRGQPAEALEAIGLALDGDMSAHTRANYLLELGHLQAWTGDYAAADEAFQEAAAAYLQRGDLLGQANVERALATNALVLGRHVQGARRLDRATELYRTLGSADGLGYVLRERAVLRLNGGDHVGALADTEEGLASFRASADTLGLAGMLRAAARVRHTVGDSTGAYAALDEARTLVKGGSNPLAEAGLLSLEAEIGEPASRRLACGREAAQLYHRMAIPTGESFALSHAAQAQADLGDIAGAARTLLVATRALRTSRGQIADAGRRGDHDFALRDVTTNLLKTGIRLGDAATMSMANLIVNEAPLGLRNAFHKGHPDPRTKRFLSRIAAMQPPLGGEPRARRHVLQQLGASIATVAPGEDPVWVHFDELATAHPASAVLAYGAPTRDGTLPIAFQTPGGTPDVLLVSLDAEAIGQIDALGYALTPERANVLWVPQERAWQEQLVGVLLPPPVRNWLITEKSPSVTVLFPPVLAHIPIEALLLDGKPLGVLAALTRLTVPTTTTIEADLRRIVSYLDPDLPWTHERLALPNHTHDPERLRDALGPDRLVFVACHGESALRAEGALVASDGTRVADAIDLLSEPLTGSVVVLEACFAGRYMGHRTGEQLNLATVSLLSGASAAVAGLFALPADDSCTGRIAAVLLHELEAGVPAAEALRRARETYWTSKPDHLRVPGQSEFVMPGDAPWAWAGLCAYSR